MSHYIVQPLFWGPFTSGEATGAVPQPWPFTAQQMIAALSQVSAAGYYSGLTEYGCQGVRTEQYPWVNTQVPNAFFNPTQGFTNDLLKQELINGIANNRIPPPAHWASIPIYLWVITHGTFNTSASGANGQHFVARFPSFFGSPPFDFIWAWIYQGDSLDDTMITATHEIVEAIGHDLHQQELSDRCQDIDATHHPRIAGWSVQSYWSVRNNACIVPGVMKVFISFAPPGSLHGLHPSLLSERTAERTQLANALTPAQEELARADPT
jgi:hypothetical protein